MENYMKTISILLVILCLLMSSCSFKPIKPKHGMALIDTRKLFTNEQLFGNKIWAVGKIISAINATNAKKIESDFLGNMQVAPGKYIIKYYCYIDGDRTIDNFYKKFKSNISTEEVSLRQGDILYINSYLQRTELRAHNGSFIGYLPTCIRDIKIRNIDDKVINKKYL